MHLAVADYEQQETSSFPDEIKTKLMKMNEEHFFTSPKIMQKCRKLYVFPLIIDKNISKTPFSTATPQLLMTIFRTKIPINTHQICDIS